MSLLPQDAGYLEQLQAFFLAFRGDGVALSPLDAELLCEWKERGVPYEVVCRGIRHVAESLIHEGKPIGRVRTLRSCRASVERELRCFERISVGRPQEAPAEEDSKDPASEMLEKARKKVDRLLRATDDPALCRALEGARLILGTKGAQTHVERQIARADEALAVLWTRSLPFEKRRSLVHQAREAAGPRREGASPRARKDALHAYLVMVARAQGKLIALL